jgi:tight adherence protein B
MFALLAFLAATLAVVGAYSFLSDLFLRDRSRLGRRVDEEFRTKQRERMRRTALFKNLSQVAMEAAAEDADLSYRRRFQMMVEQSGVNDPLGRLGTKGEQPLTAWSLIVYIALAALSCGTVATLLRRDPLVGLVVALIAGAVPFWYVWWKGQRRRTKLQTQLPEAFDLMSRVIRAGQTMTQAMQAVADDFEKPISVEFSYCCEQQNLGLPPEAALRDLARRTGILEVKIFVLAILIQQQTGGNLAEMLDKLASVMRDRARIQGKIRTLTAEGRLQAIVLLGLPVFLLVAMMLLNPRYASVLLEYPKLLAGMAVTETLGYLWIRKIVNFDF